MEKFIIENWFYLYGFVYTLDCLISILRRIFEKDKNISLDIKDVESWKNLKKENKILDKIFFVLNFTFLFIGVFYSANDLEFTYFIFLFIVGFALPFVSTLSDSINAMKDLKDRKETVIDTEYINKNFNIKKMKIFSSICNFTEIIIILLIMNNHFKYIIF